jgi:hypothetical protein
MQKKLLLGFTIALALFLMLTLVKAQDTNSSTNSSEGDDSNATIENETSIFITPLGVHIRFLQLAESIEVRTIWAESTLNFLKSETNITASDTANLEGIIAELKILSDEAKNDSTKNYTNMSLAVQDYLDIRRDAHDLLKEFRETTKKYLTEGQRAAVRRQFKELTKEEIQALKDKIQQMKKDMVLNRIEMIYKAFGLDSSDVIEKVKNGEMTADEAIAKAKSDFATLSAERRAEIRAQVNSELSTQRLEVKDVISKAQQRQLTRTYDRLGKRMIDLQKENKALAAKIITARTRIMTEMRNEMRNAGGID